MAAKQRHRVLFLIPTLAGGGAERVLIQVLGHVGRDTFEPHLALMNKTGVYFNEVPSDVQVHDLKKRGKYSFFGLQWRINRLVRETDADAVVTFVNYTNVVALMSRSVFRWNRPVIISERTTLGPSLRPQRYPWIKRQLIRMLYPRADAIIAVSEGVKGDLMKTASLRGDRIHVINNPLDTERLRELAREPAHGPYPPKPDIIAVGRLTAAKDYPTLLRAFRIVREEADARLIILGEGEERGRLESLAFELGVGGFVSFPGFLTNPYGLIARSKVFVLSSAWEGFANVITEAMACGTPVVATDCPSSPGEIIEHEVSGLLVPVGNEVSLAGAILRLLDDQNLREKLARAGAERIQEFRSDKIIKEYESLLTNVIRRQENE